METATKTRNRRLDPTRPVIRNRKIVAITPSEREEQELFPILDPLSGRYPWSYNILPQNYIAALLPDWGTEYLRRRMRELSHEPNNYLRIPEMQYENRFLLGRKCIYCHPNADLSEGEFWHDLMPNMMTAQIEIGVRQRPDLQIVNFERILNAPSMPKHGPRTWTIEVPRPDIKLKNGKTKTARSWYVTPDWQIFGVGKIDNSAFRWYVLEADKGTEPPRSRKKRKSIQSMLKRALDADRLGLAKAQFGLPEFYFLMIFSTPERMHTAMEILGEETDGFGHPRVLFGTFPVYNSYRTPIPPDGSWFRSTFARVVGKGATWKAEFRMDQL